MTTGQMEFYHSELTDWNKALGFYADEIRTFQKRLEEVVSRNTREAVLSKTGHFQNQFNLQKEQFDQLLHDIQAEERQLGRNMPGDEYQVNQPVLEEQHRLRDKVHTAEKIFMETKHHFYRYLSTVL